MELKIPPPLVALLVGLLMWLFSSEINFTLVEFKYQNLLAFVFLVVGLAIDVAAIIPFRKEKTTINPMKPSNATALIDKGIYQYSRNPMYLASLVILLGFAVWLGSILNILWLALFVWYITVFQIKPEEKILIEVFGEQYNRYKMSVRRWL